MKTRLRILLAACAMTMLAALGVQAAVFTPGPQNLPVPPGDGFPRWYADPTGTTLAPCTSQAASANGPMCILLADAVFKPANPLVFPTNYPVEAFYFIADSEIASIGAVYRAALESTFDNEIASPGHQISFVRVRWVIDPAPVSGNYRITHPFGQQVHKDIVAGGRLKEVQDVGIGVAGGPFAPINSPVDDAVAFPPTIGNLQTFLKPVGGPVTVANEVFIGDPNIPGKVTGATFLDNGLPFNAFRVEIDKDKDGVYEEMYIDENFSVAGLLLGLTASPQAGDFGTLKTGVASAPQTFTLTNVSPQPVALNVASFTSSNPDFAVTSTTCAQVVQGASCTFNVVFTPSANGARTGTITAASGSPEVPPASVKVSGAGDNIPPVIGITSPAAGSIVGPTPTLSFSSGDAVSVAVAVDGVTVDKISGQKLDALSPGEHTLMITATDLYGNSGSLSSVFSVDAVPPALTLDPLPASDADGILIIGGTVEAGIVPVVKVPGATVGPVSILNGTGWGVTISGLLPGANVITVTATDDAGNVATVTGTVVSAALAITTAAEGGGAISYSAPSYVLSGGSKTFTFVPQAGYHLESVSVNGIRKAVKNNSLTLTNIKADQALRAVFAINTYTVKVAKAVGGTLTATPAGAVPHGSSQTFTITPKAGYHLTNVVVNGVSQGAIDSYTFNSVTDAAQAISATFSNKWNITVTKSANGQVAPATASVPVINGASKSFTIKPAAGYTVGDVTLDGVSVKAQLVGTKLTITGVTADKALNVTFVPL